MSMRPNVFSTLFYQLQVGVDRFYTGKLTAARALRQHQAPAHDLPNYRKYPLFLLLAHRLNRAERREWD